jgi:hypothetical protein
MLSVIETTEDELQRDDGSWPGLEARRTVMYASSSSSAAFGGDAGENLTIRRRQQLLAE